MMVESIERIAVYFDGYGAHRLVGHVAMDGRRPVFGYDAAWVADGLPLSPIDMPLDNTQLHYGEHASSLYLCGLLADSLPDGWGMLLMDRFFRQYLNKQPHDVTVLDRFAYLGKTAMGALTFAPEQIVPTDTAANTASLDLATLAQANQRILAGHDTEILNHLIVIGGSPQGARPKALVHYDADTQQISTSEPFANAEPWLVKFPAHNEHKDVCNVEAVYATLAKRAGIIMPEHRYFDINDEHGAFGVKRFDRVKGERVHIHTLAGLLNTDFRVPTLDYTQLLRCTRMLTRSQKHVEQAYRQAVFNVIFNNKDDHSKNFSFIMSSDGEWSLAPAYDITYNTGMNGHHCMDVCGEARQPSKADLLTLAKQGDIKPKKAQTIIDDVIAVAEMLEAELLEVNEKLAESVLREVSANIERMIHL